MKYEMTFCWTEELWWNNDHSALVSKIKLISGPASWIYEFPQLERAVRRAQEGK